MWIKRNEELIRKALLRTTGANAHRVHSIIGSYDMFRYELNHMKKSDKDYSRFKNLFEKYLELLQKIAYP